jgi:hypothetical protein
MLVQNLDAIYISEHPKPTMAIPQFLSRPVVPSVLSENEIRSYNINSEQLCSHRTMYIKLGARTHGPENSQPGDSVTL